MDLNQDIKQLIREVERIWVAEVVQKIKDEIRNTNLIDSGRLENSIKSEYDDQSVDGDFKFGMVDYGKYQDQGVNPVDKKLYDTPYEFRGNVAGTAFALESWATTRGLNPWAVANVLQKEKGLKPKRFFNTTIEAMYPKLGDRITQIIIDKTTYDIQKRNK